MKIRLSSSMTFVLKFILPIVWLCVIGIGAMVAISEMSIEAIFFIMALIFGCAVIYYSFLRIKQVHIDNRCLYVSNFKESIKIPLGDITDVYDNALFSPRPIFVQLKKETEFGSRIMFIGRSQLFLFFSEHPTVREIKDRVKNIK